MIQDIYPSKLDNSYMDCEIKDEDYILFFDEEGRILAGEDDGKMLFTKGIDIKEKEDAASVYLFSLDDTRYFLALEGTPCPKDGFSYYGIRELRDHVDGKEVFAAFTAYHLWWWYADNRFCGKCGGKLELDQKERAMRCPACGHVIYPRINPAVIVGVIKDDRLLVTRYRRGYAHNALVAGFTEIGETLEETVAREVLEETGVKVKNIRYYKSQPWGMAQDLLVGFFCEAADDAEIRIDEDELKYAQWLDRDEITLPDKEWALTAEMMRVFREGHWK